MLIDVLWPLVVIGFLACVFVLLVEFVRFAVREHDAEVSGATREAAPTPTGTHAPV